MHAYEETFLYVQDISYTQQNLATVTLMVQNQLFLFILDSVCCLIEIVQVFTTALRSFWRTGTHVYI